MDPHHDRSVLSVVRRPDVEMQAVLGHCGVVVPDPLLDGLGPAGQVEDAGVGLLNARRCDVLAPVERTG